MRSRLIRRRSALALGLLGISGGTACSHPFRVSDSLGEWGGEGAAAEIGSGSASFEFDCAHASVPGGLSFDEDGRFGAWGIWVPEGGPVSVEDPPEQLEAFFRGRIDGTSMSLEVDIVPRDVTAGPYRLQRGRAAALRKCL